MLLCIMRSGIEQQLLDAIETHSAEDITRCVRDGVDVNATIDGRTPVQWLLEMYTRSARFSDCLRVMLYVGAKFEDVLLHDLLLNDDQAVADAVRANPALLHARRSLVSAYTSLTDATLLHIAAEYGLTDSAMALIEAGADVEAKAGVDEQGLNGHTPIFHAVNSNRNHCEPVLRLLLEAGAKVDVRLKGIAWGKGFEWETYFYDVTPISYAQMGLLPQVHRDERQIYANIALMLASSGRPKPDTNNVPNRYLMK